MYSVVGSYIGQHSTDKHVRKLESFLHTSCKQSETLIRTITSTLGNCRHGEVRLANSTAGRSGRVEVCINQQWGSVCDDYWDSSDATVVCRQLGLQTQGIEKAYSEQTQSLLFRS